MAKHFYYLFTLLLCISSAKAQIGFGTATPHSTLDVRGSLSLLPQLFTGNTTAAMGQQSFVFTGTAAANLTLPDATFCAGRIYWIKNASTTLPVPVLTVQPVAGQTIGGFTSAAISEPYEVVRLVSDGANWSVFSQNVPAYKSSAAGSNWYQGGNALTALRSVGTISNIDMGFMTNGVERMHISTAGFVGIGTNNPTARLHLLNDDNDDGNEYEMTDYGTTITAGIYLRKSRGTVAAPADMQNGDHISQIRFSPRYNGGLPRAEGSGIDCYYLGDGVTNLSDMRFSTSDSEHVRISATGNVAVGIPSFTGSNPERLLVDAGNTGSTNIISGKGSIDNYLQLNIRNNSGGSSASSDVVATANNGDESVNYIDMGINSGGFFNFVYPIISGINTAYLYSTGADLVAGNGSAGRDLLFFTNGYALTNERMRITASGNVGIGVMPTDKLTVAGIVAPSSDNTWSLGKSGATWRAVWAAAGAIQTSDSRLKTQIEPLLQQSATFMQLNPVVYQWRKYKDGPRKIGLLAQEVKALVPEAIIGHEATEYLGIDYSALVPVLIKQLQHQQLRLTKMNEELTRLMQSIN